MIEWPSFDAAVGFLLVGTIAVVYHFLIGFAGYIICESRGFNGTVRREERQRLQRSEGKCEACGRRGVM